jgi:hypothetical protein
VLEVRCIKLNAYRFWEFFALRLCGYVSPGIDLLGYALRAVLIPTYMSYVHMSSIPVNVLLHRNEHFWWGAGCVQQLGSIKVDDTCGVFLLFCCFPDFWIFHD